MTSTDRFWKLVSKGAACWNWTGTTRKGYGVFSLAGRRIAAHRFSWELHFGRIPGGGSGAHGWCVCHRCDNPPCVRPSHLFLGSNAENQADKAAKGRCRRQNSPTCKHGHALTGENLRMYAGKRACIACNKQRSLHHYWSDPNKARAKKRAEYNRKRGTT